MKIIFSKAFFIWGCVSLFYFYQFILRLSPSVMMEDLMKDFSMNASGFAVLASVSSLSYALSQIPLGIFTDAYGFRRSALTFLSLCILGTFLYSMAQELWLAQLGRIIIGVGAAAAFLCVSKVVGDYFSEDKVGTMFGLTMMMGTVGALWGGMPLSYIVDFLGWRQSLFVLCAVGLLILGVFFQFLPLQKVNPVRKRRTVSSVRKDLLQVIKNVDCWIFGVVALGLYITIIVLGDLWGVSFVMKAHTIERPLAANVTSFLFIGLCVGSFVLAWLSDFLGKSNRIILFCTAATFILLSLLFSPIKLSLLSHYGIFFLIGFFAGAEMLCFSEACKVIPSSLTGTALGFINTLVVLGAGFVQQVVGFALDLVWGGSLTSEGIRFYSLTDYKLALSLVIPVAGLSLVASFFLREDPVWVTHKAS